MEEIWKPVAGYETLYSVSNLGRVMSLGIRAKRNVANVILSPVRSKTGYCGVQLSRDGVKIGFLVHRLVAHAFLGAGPDGTEVNHIDFDRANNRAENLEWITHKQNIRHSHARSANRKGEANGKAKLTNGEVLAMRERYAAGGISFAKLGVLYGIGSTQCHLIISGQSWGHV